MDLRAANIIDSSIEGHYAFFSFVEQITTQEHHHDFYEIFLVTSGSIYHHINGQPIHLESGALVFIRPDDAHYFQPDGDHNCELINVAFLRKTYNAMAKYLNLGEHEQRLLSSELPPTISLTVTEAAQVINQLKRWGRSMYRDKSRSRLALRSILSGIVTNFFVGRVEDFPADAPHWFIDLCQKMQQKPHVVEGRDALLRLANRSPEHIGRVFKTYLDITPSEFINNLRLDYASDLLLNTDLPATSVCYEVGFENASHFYRLFKARWGSSPNAFRKHNQRTLIP